MSGVVAKCYNDTANANIVGGDVGDFSGEWSVNDERATILTQIDQTGTRGGVMNDSVPGDQELSARNSDIATIWRDVVGDGTSRS